MDKTMKLFQEKLIEIEAEGEYFLLAKHQQVENDRMRNGNREALTALRKRARTTKTSVPSPFELLMNEIDDSKPLVKEICATCGNHDSKEKTWMMFPGTDIFARVPFHAAHTILEKDQTRLDYDGNKLQSYIKEKSFVISELGALADKIGPGVLKSLVTLEDKPKSWLSNGDFCQLDGDEKEKIEAATKEALEWLDENQSAEKEEYDEKLKEVEVVCNPIITADLTEDDDEHDEL